MNEIKFEFFKYYILFNYSYYFTLYNKLFYLLLNIIWKVIHNFIKSIIK